MEQLGNFFVLIACLFEQKIDARSAVRHVAHYHTGVKENCKPRRFRILMFLKHSSHRGGKPRPTSDKCRGLAGRVYLGVGIRGFCSSSLLQRLEVEWNMIRVQKMFSSGDLHVL